MAISLGLAIHDVAMAVSGYKNCLFVNERLEQKQKDQYDRPTD